MTMHELIGQTINNYELQEVVGEGSMGIVFRGYHAELQTYVAVKVLRPELVNFADSFERFLQEARTAARLEHPNIVKVQNFGEIGASYYLMMEYVEGPSLRELLNDYPNGLELTQVAQIFTQIASVLAVAHQQGVLHRDLKPDNILLTRSLRDDDRPYKAMVTDFGLVKILKDSLTDTKEGTTMGTPAYMAPEQCVGDPIDERADLYALGVMLYEAITGKRPYPIRSLFDAVKFHGSGNFVAPRAHVPTLPVKLNVLVRKMMSPEIDKRPSTAADVVKQLARFLPKSNQPDTSTDRILERIHSETNLVVVTPDETHVPPSETPKSEETMREASKPLPYCIVVTYKGSVDRVYPPLVAGETLVIGRMPDVEIVLDSPERYVSKQHCRIEVGDEKVFIRDLSSTNGTFLGATRIEADVPIEWDENTDINLGAFKLSLQYQGQKRVSVEARPMSADEVTLVQGRYTLVCEESVPARLPLLIKPIVIGRVPGCDLVLNNTRVSKRHCRIEMQADESIAVTDLNSTNGTFIKNRRLLPNQPVMWDGNTPIRVGDFLVALERLG